MSWFSERRREEEPFASDDDPKDFAAEDDGAEGFRWAVVGRFANVAEAGYFAEELRHELDAPVRVRAEPSFDGMHHFWRTRYVLTAPESMREEAATTLAGLVSRTSAIEEPASFEAADEGESSTVELAAVVVGRESPFGRTSFEDAGRGERFDPEETGGGIAWAPIMLTLTAGSAVFFGFRWWHDGPRDPGPLPAHGGAGELWDAMSHEPSSWTQTLPDGRGRRSVRFTRRHDAAILEEDTDGDGKAERTVVIPRGEPK